ncbi:uncharacterized protein CHSO_0055 [Chryseobacterium sp. StRB126]|uniref:hypothetical protein n=1 Tax=Chryseobacterium sp. StRB126 TaxID=878220 RepID=UPI0004E98A0A|nr:hypothetical protein [Chryseobacterium sp. StRB126]BAP29092.1 uncharacterized protein CHSO_0055 [Chryseobacterium sp. StRB126]
MRTIKILFGVLFFVTMTGCEKYFFSVYKPHFEDSVPRKDESAGTLTYQQKNPTTKKDFEIDFVSFNGLIQDNISKKYCKFYYVQENNELNIVMTFSELQGEYEYTEGDIYYELDNGFFKEITDIEKLKNGRSFYKANLGKSMYTEMIEYTTNNVNSYNYNVSNLIYDVTKLKFVMMFKTKSKQEYAVFAVHPVNKNNSINETNTFGYDAGTLYP